MTAIGGTSVAPPEFAADNRAFDVTPAALVTGIVTEAGVATAPYDRSLRAMVPGGSDEPDRGGASIS